MTAADIVVPTDFLRFRRDLRVEVGTDEVFLFDDRGVTALRGAGVAALAPLMDGTRDVTALMSARPVRMSGDDVGPMLERLVSVGLVVRDNAPAVASADRSAEAWWEGCGIEPRAEQDHHAVVEIACVGDGADADAVVSALAAAGVVGSIGARRAGPPPALSVVLCEDYLDPRLGAIDDIQRRAGRPWLLANATGARLWLGPVFRPGSSACWHCLSHRLAGHRRPEELARASLGLRGHARPSRSTVPPIASAGAHLVALETVKWLGGYRYTGQDSVWVFDSYATLGDRHELRRRPQCPHCGDPAVVADRMAAPVVLRPAPKVAGSGGGHRTAGPSEMIARYRHLVSPVTGIVKRVAPDPVAPPFVHAWLSGANVSRATADLAGLRRTMRSQNGGKGLSASDAEVGALCEAVERFSGTWQGDEPRVRGTLRGLSDRAVDPRNCLLFDDEQGADRSAWNREHSPFNRVPDPFDPDAEHDWTPMWSLTGNRRRLLPTAMLFFGAPGDASLFADSNGCAAGASLEDAVLQGLLELIERDAVGLWWYNRARLPGVDPTAFGDARFAEQVAQHDRVGRELRVLDVSADLRVPVMAAVSRLRRPARDGGERILLGFGAHLDPAVALARALAEVNQMLPAAGVDPAGSGDPDWARWASATLDRDYLVADPAVDMRGLDHYPVRARDDVRDDVRSLVDELARHGLEVLAIDQTRPDLELPVARVLVPGLRSFWARFAPGRLFDVPVSLGRQSTPTPYHRLNPEPLFL